MDLLRFLLEDYSKRGLTKKTDKCVAISGLETRIAGALQCQSKYGVFERYLHRNILWQASDCKMERIEYENQNVPSWSWMAYNGGIRFMNIRFGAVDWINNLRFDTESDRALITEVGKFRDCTLEQKGERYVISDFSGTKRGWIQYDVERGEDICKEEFVVIGKKNNKCKDEDEDEDEDEDADEDEDILGVTKYYILVVRPNSVEGEYRRAGVGRVQSDYAVRQRLEVRVV
jgi:hypothetical protein